MAGTNRSGRKENWKKSSDTVLNMIEGIPGKTTKDPDTGINEKRFALATVAGIPDPNGNFEFGEYPMKAILEPSEDYVSVPAGGNTVYRDDKGKIIHEVRPGTKNREPVGASEAHNSLGTNESHTRD